MLVINGILKKARTPISTATLNSLLALIEWWLENKTSPPPAQMGRIHKALIIDATISVVASG
jgi:hypothetical protein